jgi:hypothetical protein
MPISYQFVDRATREPVKLAKVDEEVCELAGIHCDPKRYSFLYNAITMTGLAMLSRSKRDPVDEEAFKAYLEANEDVFDEKDREIFHTFLIKRYIFTAWWQAKH